MKEPLVRHQIIEYQQNEPFYIANTTNMDSDDECVKNSHWHSELEIAYILRGRHLHYIDGEVIHAQPGRLIVTNCESVHHIEAEPDDTFAPDEIRTIVLIVHNRFIEDNFPEYRDFLFTNEQPQARPEIRDIMLQFSEYRKRAGHRPNEHLYMRGLLLQLLYYLYEDGTISRTSSTIVKQHEKMQPIKEVLQYVERHYREPITQADVARWFHFTPQYFARYFKKYTGVTFIEHLTAYRVSQAKKELLSTDRPIGDIALDCGFNDNRCFNNAFKKQYRATPNQYRRNDAKRRQHGGKNERG